MNPALALWLPPAGWAAVLLMASALPGEAVPGAIPDWILHGSAYLILGLLVCRALAGGLGLGLSRRQALAALLACTCFGVFDEWTQRSSRGRDASASDVAKDAVGAALAALMWRARWPLEERETA